ncbi:hypothetical protein BC962_2034 [Gillisia mitskevichiae]|uniref:Uncharacterized protein n=1 Tax=Gillisia mitskevichiae TaxID=270921 RepID=A0A495PWB1_9FLAO|nr:hypothetical protein [Gillisia mitskevichiae]RKS53778.1 hypothetical protein BC962_2034 [Gillisia mitskevichiae]
MGWDIVNEEELGDIGYFIELEKENVTGTKLMVGWIKEVELNILLSSVRESLESKMSYVNSNWVFKIAKN